MRTKLREMREGNPQVTWEDVEAEWEKAARGEDMREYPWGNTFGQNHANCWDDETGALKDTSTVGCFPHGASPYGVEELSGNVWEWTRARHQPYRDDRQDYRLEAFSGHRRVVRGGSFLDDHRNVRASFRGNFERRFRDIHTITQQLQGRQSLYENVGQVLLGLEPDALLFTT